MMSENRPVVPIPINNLNSYPNASMSRKSIDIKQAQAKPEPVVSTKGVVFKKQSAWKQLKHRVFKENASDIKDYIIDSVLIPTLKNAVIDTFQLWLFGSTDRYRSGYSSGGSVKYGNYVNYNSIASARPGFSRGGRVDSVSSHKDYLALDELYFPTRAGADKLLSNMRSVISTYGFISIARMYDFMYEEGSDGVRRPIVAPATYNNFGWYNLDYPDARVELRPDGYLLILPDYSQLV